MTFLRPKAPTHKRMKEKRAAVPTAAERRHWERIAQMPCAACGKRPVTIHHVTSDGYKRIARSHKLVTPLCKECHQIIWNSKDSIEAIGHAEFCRRNGVDLLALAERLWKESQEMENG